MVYRISRCPWQMNGGWQSNGGLFYMEAIHYTLSMYWMQFKIWNKSILLQLFQSKRCSKLSQSVPQARSTMERSLMTTIMISITVASNYVTHCVLYVFCRRRRCHCPFSCSCSFLSYLRNHRGQKSLKPKKTM